MVVWDFLVCFGGVNLVVVGGGDWFWVSGVGRLLCGVNLGMMG
ncbi:MULTISPECIES: hypothetical protein [Campylobacter]|nr:hypothetical protein [Campylobacter sp. P0024]MCR8679613.1 hypothetical protein [Campylobacter sp. RM19072]